MLRWSLAIAAVLVVSAATAARTVAEPLSKEQCEALKAEQAELTAAGAREQLARGADWGKVNLSMEQLQRVERFIAVEEQLSFRCGLARLRASLPVTEEGGEQELDDKGQPIPQKKQVDEAGEPKAKPKPKPKPKPPEKAAAKPPPKPKPKVDDAYRPPNPNPNANPFAASGPPAQQQKQ
jgi:hypothetical protein